MSNTEKAIKEALLRGDLRESLASLLAVAERSGEEQELREQMTDLQRDGTLCDAWTHRMSVEAALAGRAADPVAFVREQLELFKRATANAPKARIRLNMRPRSAAEIAISAAILKENANAN